jgi:non-ribosomal peptide synthetase component F
LRAQGVGADRLVGLCVERSLEMVIGMLGILKAGGAYVPLDPAYPSERVQYMLKDARPAVVLTQESIKRQPVDCATTIIALDTQWNEIAQQPTSNVSGAEVGVSTRNLAYVIYTSGSTGQPKGVMIEHVNVVNFWSALEQAVYDLHSMPRYSSSSNYSRVARWC